MPRDPHDPTNEASLATTVKYAILPAAVLIAITALVVRSCFS